MYKTILVSIAMVVSVGAPVSSWAQEVPSWMTGAGDTPMGSYRLHADGASMGLGVFEMPAQAPLVYDGCLIAEDGLTPIVCASGDSLGALPEGFVWRDDTTASPDAPRHCLWWEEGGRFVGTLGTEICREGALGKPRDRVPPAQLWAEDGAGDQPDASIPSEGADGESSF